MVIPWKESWHKKMWPTLKSAIDFSRSPLLCVVKMELPKNTVIIRLMSLFGSYILGIFFHVEIQIIDDFNDEFLICKWQVYKIFFLTSWTWTKKWCFELQMYNVQIIQSNISVMYHNFHLWTPHQISLTMIKQLHV